MDRLIDYWPHLIAVVGFGAALVASGHVVIRKRDTRSAIGWFGLIWLAPLLGSLLYWLLGINRIQRRGKDLHGRRRDAVSQLDLPREDARKPVPRGTAEYPRLFQMVRVVSELTDRPLLPGNTVRPLLNGDETYPEMLAAIDSAQQSISLVSYIFDNDSAGAEFLDALQRARNRGVQVRVLVDGVGTHYSRPTIQSALKHHQLPHALFLPTRVPRLFNYANLRNHRKILVVDGRIGFTGGLNIREGCRLGSHPSHPVQDIHFRIEGPVVAHLQEAFATDWGFTTDEVLAGDLWFPSLDLAGDIWARGISDGPDEDFDKLRLAIHGAIAVAESRLLICTPYFLPDPPMVTALSTAAMRGVDVRVIIPEHNNIKLVEWACMAQLEELLERGVRIWLAPGPFDHSKLLLVDNGWSLIGSSNWDDRSLRLNFEFNVECYSEELNEELAAIFDQKQLRARELTWNEWSQRPFPIRIRDGLARLASPYL
ncbi:MAG: cardiolipin synthase [Maioricimonas sp. JB049]